jgi:hypothetical protein
MIEIEASHPFFLDISRAGYVHLQNIQGRCCNVLPQAPDMGRLQQGLYRDSILASKGRICYIICTKSPFSSSAYALGAL